jgi:four helix bundle protein
VEEKNMYAVRSARLLAAQIGYGVTPGSSRAWGVRSYRTLVAWKRAHEALVLTLRSTDAAYHPRARSLFDQIRRAAISVEANIVEGYALNTPALCRRHLRIAFGSAAEAECLVRAALELEYLDRLTAKSLLQILDSAMGALHGLLRAPPVTAS